MPTRGEIWLASFNPVRGHEQAGTRPALILSADAFNSGPAGLVVVIPLTTRERRVPLHVEIKPPEGNLRTRSFAMCEMVRSISTDRLAELWGRVEASTMHAIEDRVRILLDM